MARTLAELLQTRMTATGLTQGQAAHHCGVEQTTFGRWLKGKIPHRDNVPAIAGFLRITVTAAWKAIGEQQRRDSDVSLKVMGGSPAS